MWLVFRMLEHSPKQSPEPVELSYAGRVTEKGTGQAIHGAAVVVRRMRFAGQERRILQETKHETDEAGRYWFALPPEQVAEPALYVEVDVEHPDYAPRKNFGYSLAMIRKNERLGGRPFFENVELDAGDPIMGRVSTPDGGPAAGVKVLAHSQPHTTHLPEYGSFASTTTDDGGVFRLTVVKGGSAILWLLPEQFAPSAHPLEQRGDLGRFVLEAGIRLRGKVLDAQARPVAAIWVNAHLEGPRAILGLAVADQNRRCALTSEQGEFELAPLPPGSYRVEPNEHGQDCSRDGLQPRALPGVFASQQILMRDGQAPGLLLFRAMQAVTIEAQYVDRDGKPHSGPQFFMVGQIDGSPYHTIATPDADGKTVIQAPLGLQNAELHPIANEHTALRHQIGHRGALSNCWRILLGTLERDVRDIRIIRYHAPVVLVRVRDRSGEPIRGAQVQATYGAGKGPWHNLPQATKFMFAPSDVHFERQEDGQWRSFQVLPDEPITVTVQAAGYEPRSQAFQLPEGAQKELEFVLEKNRSAQNS